MAESLMDAIAQIMGLPQGVMPMAAVVAIGYIDGDDQERTEVGWDGRRLTVRGLLADIQDLSFDHYQLETEEDDEETPDAS